VEAVLKRLFTNYRELRNKCKNINNTDLWKRTVQRTVSCIKQSGRGAINKRGIIIEQNERLIEHR
jgi:hypothetical protein